MDLLNNTLQALHGLVLSLDAAERSPDTDLQQLRSAVHQVRCQLNCTMHDLRQYLCRLGPCGRRDGWPVRRFPPPPERIRLTRGAPAGGH